MQAFDDVRPAIIQLERAGVPLVLCTEKQRAQIEPLRLLLESDAPFIVENGDAVFVPNGYFSPTPALAGGTRLGDYTMYQPGAVVARPVRTLPMSDRFQRAGTDKGIAVRLLASLYRSQLGDVRTVGIGQGPRDADLLSVVDVPIGLSSRHAPALRRLVPNVPETSFPGPRGWNKAILELLDVPE
jgi:predicted mannosyl-3-phosphoglycerate phosphatase (HAD superfamily)